MPREAFHHDQDRKRVIVDVFTLDCGSGTHVALARDAKKETFMYLVGSRGKGEPSSGANHLGFRCVASPSL